METIQGKITRPMDALELAGRIQSRRQVLIDIGAGDGKFILHAARRDPGLFGIGVDACRENLREGSRNAPENALFVIAAAQSLPDELHGRASRLAINFPWGSLLEGLLQADPALLGGLARLVCPGAQIEIRLNQSAAQEAGWELATAGDAAAHALRQAGFTLRDPARLGPADLRALPSTWAKRLASAWRKDENKVALALAIQGRYRASNIRP